MENLQTRNLAKDIVLGGTAVARINLHSGENSIGFEDISASSSVMGIGVSHWSNYYTQNKRVGKEFQFNLDQTFKKNDDGQYVYTDGQGKEFPFTERYFYIVNGERMPLNKTIVKVDEHGQLYCGASHVMKECTSTNGLKAITEYDVTGSEFLDQRQEALVEIDQKINAQKEVLSKYVLVNQMTLSVSYRLEDYIASQSSYEVFMNQLFSDTYVLSTYHITTVKTSDLTAIIANEQANTEELKGQYNYYRKLLAERENIVAQLPTNFLTDGEYIRGYNQEGKLVVVYDKNENYAVIEREEFLPNNSEKRISRLVDNKGKEVIFGYNEKYMLDSITDTRGRRTTYEYDTDGKLTEVNLWNGRKLTFVYYDDGLIESVEEEKLKLKSVVTYNDLYRITQVDSYSLVNVIGGQSTDEGEHIITTLSYENGLGGNCASVLITIDNNKQREKYVMNNNGQLTEYYLEENGKVTKAERYQEVDYWDGTTEQENPIKEVLKADEDILNQTAIENFNFTSCEYDRIVPNQYEKPLGRDTRVKVSDMTSGKFFEDTHIDYVYDINQNLVEEIIEIKYVNFFASDSSETVDKTINARKKYFYDNYGRVIKTERYVVGEEQTNGKEIEESVYDSKGNLVKSFRYNTKEPSSKFYTEYYFDDNGEMLAENDDAGEYRKVLEYVDGTKMVRVENLPNQSRLAYAYDEEDNLVSITHSTEDGEENSVNKRYENGQLVELTNGNKSVKYTYDSRGRVTNVNLNGVENYAQYIHNESATDDIVEHWRGNGEFEKTDTKKDGSGISKYYKPNYNSEYVQTYNATFDNKGRILSRQDNMDSSDNTLKTTTNYAYETTGVEKSVKEVTTADGNLKMSATKINTKYGQLGRNTYTLDNNETIMYSYYYNSDSKMDVNQLDVKFKLNGTLGNVYTENYTRDSLGRIKETSFTAGGKTYKKRYLYYKSGDHTTDRVSAIYHSQNGRTYDKENIIYDEMGNIVEIRLNGGVKTQYQYDKLGRIIYENNIDSQLELWYTYDDNGRLLNKKKTQKTSDSVTSTENVYTYGENNDRLMFYGEPDQRDLETATTLFEYDTMGNPTSYFNRSFVWKNGRLVNARNVDKNADVSMEYDADGLRVRKTVSGTLGNTTNYLYDDGKLIRETTGTQTIEYFYGAEGVKGFKKIENSQNGAQTEEVYFYRKNIFGDVIAIIKQNGEEAGKYYYTSFGALINAENLTDIARINPFRYRSYYYDRDLGLYYLKSRYYDQVVGRFISLDDIEYIDPDHVNGLNLYSYCGNNPIMYVDPTGHAWWDWLLAGIIFIGLVIGAIFTGGAFTGAAIGAGMSIFNQALTGEFNWLQFALDTSVGALTGAIGASGISIGGSTVLGAVISGGSNVLSQVIQGKSLGEIDWSSVLFSTILGGAVGAWSGAGARNLKELSDIGFIQQNLGGGSRILANMNSKALLGSRAAREILKESGFGRIVLAQYNYSFRMAMGKYIAGIIIDNIF